MQINLVMFVKYLKYLGDWYYRNLDCCYSYTYIFLDIFTRKN